jgi:uncharacterized phage-associated protein
VAPAGFNGPFSIPPYIRSMTFNASLPPAVRTALDVATWFLDRARADDTHLPFQKLHRLLYLAQSLFAAQNGGLLMPAFFQAEEIGPIEPNLQRLLADGRPEDLLVETPTGQVRDFLESVWERYAHMPVERLNDQVAKNGAYRNTAPGYIIDTAAMALAVAAPVPALAPPVRVLRSQSGAAVAVRAWSPASLASSGTGTTKPQS